MNANDANPCMRKRLANAPTRIFASLACHLRYWHYHHFIHSIVIEYYFYAYYNGIKVKNFKKVELLRYKKQTMKMKISKGFTIIELLVVVAIIAVLTGIVLVNVTSYINKGKDSAVQGNLSSLLTNQAVYYDTNGSYTGGCASAAVVAALAAADRAFDGNGTAGEVTDCAETAALFAACGQLKVSDAYFCVDSTGTKKNVATRTACVAAWDLTACP